MLSRVAVVVAAAQFAVVYTGCGLLSTEPDGVDISVGPETFIVDSQQWQIDAELDEFPSVSCGSMPSLCDAAVGDVCTNDSLCTSLCVEQQCAARLLVSLFRTIELSLDQPELDSLAGDPPLNIAIADMTYSIVENTFANSPLPTLTVYAAPVSVMSSSAPSAVELGTIPTIPSGTEPGSQSITLSDAGRVALASFMAEYRTAFNLLVSGTLELRAGDPVPDGLMRVEVSVTARAAP